MATVTYGTVTESIVTDATISPAIPGSPTATSVLLAAVINRSTATVAFTETGAGSWSLVFDAFTDGAITGPVAAVFIAPGTETTPPSLSVAGQASPVCGVVIRVDGALVSDPVGGVGAQVSVGGGVPGSDYTVGPIDPPTLEATDGVVFCLSIHRNLGNAPCTDSTITANSGAAWVESMDHFTSLGSDVSLSIFHRIYTTTPALAAETVTFSGGNPGAGQYGRMFEIKAGAGTVAADYIADSWAQFSGLAAGVVSERGAYDVDPWAAFSGAAAAAVSVTGAYSAAPWAAFSGAATAAATVSGSYSATWQAFSGTYTASSVSGIAGQYSAQWPDFGFNASGTIALAASYEPAVWDDFAIRYRGTVVLQLPPETDVAGADEVDQGGNDLMWSLISDGEHIYADIALDRAGTPRLSSDLRTAVMLSIGSDARATADDFIPDGTADRRGWWGDAFLPDGIVADEFGSRRWLLAREKQLMGVLKRVEEIDRASLQWLIEDGIAESVDVVESFPRPGWLLTDITIYRPRNQSPATYRFEFAWDAQARISDADYAPVTR